MVNELLKECIKNGFLLDREMLEYFGILERERASKIISTIEGVGIKERIITKKVFLKNLEMIKSSLLRFSNDEGYEEFFSSLSGGGYVRRKPVGEEGVSHLEEGKKNKVKLIKTPSFLQRKIGVGDFVRHFRSRFESLRDIFEGWEFENLTSIRKIGQSKGNYTIIACVVEKRITKSKNILITVEDLTGTGTVLVNQSKKESFLAAEGLLLDDIVAFRVTGNSDLLFCNEIIYPEASLDKKRYHDEDVWVAFASDFHCGSRFFLENEALRFIKWINGEEEGKYNDIAKKIKYLFIVGDLVDGVNHYPGQEKDLKIFSCREQYKKFEEFMKLVRDDIEIIICPGDHDAVWIGEPQGIISKEWAPGLNKMSNVFMVPNPSLIEIAGGFKVLMYHGASINSMIEEMPLLRVKYGKRSPTVIVKEMIKRRHLAPMHGFVDYIPCEIDPMVIDPVPDIIVTGDLHTVDVGTKNNILMISGSCFQGMIGYQEKRGVVSDPCKVPLFNLKTREIKILDFSEKTKEVEWDLDESLVCELNLNEKGG